MTTDFRALCIELTDCLEKADWPFRYRHVFRQWVDIARAALADEPAVPEGREPVSVTGQPSDEAWDALVERAWDKYQTVGYQGERFMYDRDFDSALEFVRQGLARWGKPTPVPPADGEVAELVQLLGSMAAEAELADQVHDVSVLTRAAELLQRQVLVPVPVSERLPGPEDCDAEGRCWWWYPEVPGKTYGYWAHEDDAVPDRALNEQPLHWLPAQALPLPEVK